jgi:hypothetical protein
MSSFHKERGEEVWTLSLFEGNEGRLPFLNEDQWTAPHQFEIITYKSRPYYHGEVDANLFLRHMNFRGLKDRPSVYLLDIGLKYAAYFLNGEMKDAYDSGGKHIASPEEFIRSLTQEYFKNLPTFQGEQFIKMIVDSNLPEEKRNAVRALQKSNPDTKENREMYAEHCKRVFQGF